MASLLPWQPSFPHHNITHTWHWCFSFSQNNVNVNNLIIKPRRKKFMIKLHFGEAYIEIPDNLWWPPSSPDSHPFLTIILHTCDIICLMFIMYTFRQQKEKKKTKKRQININGGGQQLESVHQVWLNCRPILCVLRLKLRVVFILCF